ncbi:hypothetical protein [Rodentibacter genomosp. 2]|uniref:Uncharacterized protein n=2 Tax=Rodentibacter TaxID=1960084 RepID=A0A1V3JML5_9PAST|nr:hypothetical protein [Rodentibacter genomosp. 2]OOF57492.1 hypothetical protein BKK55_04330 [Rodentibacter genomosp. 2]
MCQKNYVLELGKIIISRRILSEVSAEKINELISYHKNGYIVLRNGELIQRAPEPRAEIVMNFYLVNDETIVIRTLLNDEGNWRTEIHFEDESNDHRRGYFDWMLHQSRKSPFTLGNVVCTAEVKKSLGMQHIHRLIEKQLSYDWGMVGLGDWTLNDRAVENGRRVLSHHYIGDEYVYVITEADRCSTTIMFSYEY